MKKLLYHLSAFALRQAIGDVADKALTDWISRHCTDPNGAVPKAIERAGAQSWQALELALRGGSFGGWLERRFAPSATRGLVLAIEQVLKAEGEDFRHACLDELKRLAAPGGLATDPDWQATCGECVVLREPGQLLIQARTVLAREAAAFEANACPHLARLVVLPTPGGGPLLLVLFNSALQCEIAQSTTLTHLLQCNLLQQLQQASETQLAMLAEIIERLPEAVRTAPAQPRITAILRGTSDVRLYTSLAERLREQTDPDPQLLDALGKLALAVGEPDQASGLFQQAAAQQAHTRLKAEACYNAYLAALEQGDWDGALAALHAAVADDPERFEPFPLRTYSPERILGAGGFGVAFLCRQVRLDERVVVKTLRREDLDRELSDIFREGSLLAQLNHPGIVQVKHADYCDAAETRPFLVMEYIDAPNLEDQLPLLPERDIDQRLDAVLPLARAIAEAVAAAHRAGILHRDLKPDNILARRLDTGSWQVKLIDFGLALQRRVIKESMLVGNLSHSVIGECAAGALDYGSPEQMGKRRESVGPYSDVYGYGRTLCACLFGRPNPAPRDWRRLAEHPFGELLEDCIEDDPAQRPQDFTEVLRRLPAPGGVPGIEPEPVPIAPGGDPQAADNAAYAEAIRQDSIAGFKAYLGAHPKGRHAAAARSRLGELADAAAWAEARREDSEDAYRRYLARPEPKTHQSEAAKRLAVRADDTAWIAAQSRDTVAAYQAYLDGSGLKRHAGEAERRKAALIAAEAERDRLAWEAAAKAHTRKAYQAYLDGDTVRGYARDAQDGLEQCADEALWQDARRVDTEAAYEGYLAQSTRHGFKREAEERLTALRREADRVAWEAIGPDARRQDYQSFAAKARTERYRRLAEERIARMRSGSGASQSRRRWFDWGWVTGAIVLFGVIGLVAWYLVQPDPDDLPGGSVASNPPVRDQPTTPAPIPPTPPKPAPPQPFEPEMVLIEAGRFQMGSPESEPGHHRDERLHWVQIEKDFEIGKYELTQAQWEAVMGSNPSWFKGRDRPVERVSWNDAMDYIDKLNQRTGKDYRLPTEAEWEYATRAGTSTRYWWGDEDPVCRKGARNGAKFDDNAGCDDTVTEPVGSYSANPWGLYDVHGNVWEWTCSEWALDYDGSEQRCAVRQGGSDRVLRGGSWYYGPADLRSADRDHYAPHGRYGNLGLRLARTLP